MATNIKASSAWFDLQTISINYFEIEMKKLFIFQLQELNLESKRMELNFLTFDKGGFWARIASW